MVPRLRRLAVDLRVLERLALVFLQLLPELPEKVVHLGGVEGRRVQLPLPLRLVGLRPGCLLGLGVGDRSLGGGHALAPEVIGIGAPLLLASSGGRVAGLALVDLGRELSLQLRDLHPELALLVLKLAGMNLMEPFALRGLVTLVLLVLLVVQRLNALDRGDVLLL